MWPPEFSASLQPEGSYAGLHSLHSFTPKHLSAST